MTRPNILQSAVVAVLALAAAAGLFFLRPPANGGDFPGQSQDEILLTRMWNEYKRVFISPEGYTWDALRNETTSEGQSYALLRAAWMGDREIFERCLLWTDSVLKRPDGLYSWKWNRYTRTIVDPNTATDGDVDIAFALMIAADRFNKPEYLDKARNIARAVKAHTAIPVGPGDEDWFYSAGNWAVPHRTVNLSYFAPYEHPYFAAIDPDSDWPAATRAGYRLLAEMLAKPGVRLPWDFSKAGENGECLPPVDPNLSTDFSFDAMRVYFRVALDCSLLQNPQACADPAKSAEIAQILARDGKLFTRYSTDGKAKSKKVSVSFYGGALPLFALFKPQAAQALKAKEFAESRITKFWADQDRYYDLNWLWFGLAAESGFIKKHTPPVERFLHPPKRSGK